MIVVHPDAPAGARCWWCSTRGVDTPASRTFVWRHDAEQPLAAAACDPCSSSAADFVSRHTAADLRSAGEPGALQRAAPSAAAAAEARKLVVQVLEWLTDGYDGPDIPGEQLTVVSTLQDATALLGDRWTDRTASEPGA